MEGSIVFVFYHHLYPLAMADPAPYLKSLGTFHPILEAADAEYRDADTDARVAVIEQLMDELREVAIAKQCVLAADHILQKVSTCVSYPTYIPPDHVSCNAANY